MTLFETNLAELRRRAGYTQESLAEALGISRQAVGKWESGQGLPEAATLLALADLLGCSLDQLMCQPLDQERSEEREDPAENWAGFSRHMDRFSITIALSVLLVLVGVALTVAAGVLGESPVLALPMLLCAAVAAFLFVFGYVDHGNYLRSYPVPPACPDPEREAKFAARLRIGLPTAVAGILICVALEVVAVVLLGDRARLYLATAGILLLLGLCAGAMVYLVIQHEKYVPTPQTPERPNLSVGLMLTATAAFLLLCFWQGEWHPGWVAIPIAGVLCCVLDSLRRK